MYIPRYPDRLRNKCRIKKKFGKMFHYFKTIEEFEKRFLKVELA